MFILIITNAYGIKYYSRASASWSQLSTWSLSGCGGPANATVLPGASDTVIICTGHTVVGNTNASIRRLEIYGTLNFSAIRTINVATNLELYAGANITGTRTGTINVSQDLIANSGAAAISIGRCNLTVSGNLIINSGSTVQFTNSIGIKTFNNIYVYGQLTNPANINVTINGSLHNDNTINWGANTVTFASTQNATITGSATTKFNIIVVNKGTDATPILDVQSVIDIAPDGLRLINGTFKLSSASSITPFTSTASATMAPCNATWADWIPSTAQLWLAGPGTVNVPFNLQMSGTLRISNGTFIIGDQPDERFVAICSTTRLIIEGGELRIAGRLSRATANDALYFEMSGGTFIVPTVGSTSTTFAPIMLDQPSSTFIQTGGKIYIERPGGANLGFIANAGTVGISGGEILIGDANTPVNSTIRFQSTFPVNTIVVNSANVTCQLDANLSLYNSLKILAGVFNTNGFNVTIQGNFENYGTFLPTTSTVTFSGSATQIIKNNGVGDFYNFVLSKSSGEVILQSNITINNGFTMNGGIITTGAYVITLGTSGLNPGALSYSSGVVNGKFRRWVNTIGTAYLWPIGTLNYYRPVSINFSNLTVGSVLCEFISQDPGTNGLPLSDGIFTVIDRYSEGFWRITPLDGASSNNFYVECTGNGFTSYPIGPSTRLIYRANGNSPWSINGTHVNATGSTAKRNAVNGLSCELAFGKTACSPYVASSIIGPDNVCVNSSQSYSVNNSTANNTYVWSLKQGLGTIANGQNTPNVTINWGAAGGYDTLVVKEVNDCGDTSTTSLILPIKVHPIPTSPITGPTNVPVSEVDSYYVNFVSGYSYNWALSGGGTIISGQGTNKIFVQWNTAGTYTISVTVTPTCNGTPETKTLNVTVRKIVNSVMSGNWTNTSTWDCVCIPTSLDFVVINPGHTVVMNGNPGNAYRLTIKGTATWTAARTTNVGNGGIIIESTGNITGTVNGVLTTTGGIKGIGNSNIISTTVDIRLITNNGQTISSDGAFNKLTINVAAYNNGTVKISNNGQLGGTGTLIQNPNTILELMTNNITIAGINASALGNTVLYSSSLPQNIRPITYYNLELSSSGGSSVKSLAGDISILGNLKIQSSTTLDVTLSNYSIKIAGNWENYGTFDPRFGQVEFNGNSSQSIYKSSGQENFNRLVLSGTGAKNLLSPIYVSYDLIINSSFNTNNYNVNLEGNLSISSTGSYNSGSDTIFFRENSLLLGNPPTFSNVFISSGAVLTSHQDTVFVKKNWINNGTFEHNTGSVKFTGISQRILGDSITKFFNLFVSSSDTLFLLKGIGVDNNLVINTKLDVSSQNSPITINGNWINNGEFIERNGRVDFIGNASTIMGSSPTTFYDLGIGASSNVTLLQNTKLKNILYNNGILKTNGYELRLISEPGNTARIAPLPAGADILGNITMERYTGSSALADFRQYSSAVSGATIADWADDFVTWGITGGTCYPGQCPSNPCIASWWCSWPSIYWYDETINDSVAQGATNGYVPVSSVSDPIVPGRGYFVYQSTTPDTFELTGPPNKFKIHFPVSYTDHGRPDDDGWNLVANPYPAPIDWDHPSWNKSNILSSIYIWNATIGDYASYTSGGVGVNGGSRYIASQQAFWVKATGPNPSLIAFEDVKVVTGPGANPNVLKLYNHPNKSQVPLVFQDFPIPQNVNDSNYGILFTVKSANFINETYIGIRNGSTDTFDYFYDAYELTSDYTINIMSVSPPYNLSINCIPLPTTHKSIPLRIIMGSNLPDTLNITIQRDSILMMPLSSCLFLEDLKTGNVIDLRTNISYTFAHIKSDTAPRFLLHIYPPAKLVAQNPTCNGYSNGSIIAYAPPSENPPITYSWSNSSGNIIKSTINSPYLSDTLSNVPAGLYFVTISSNICGQVVDTIIVGEPSQLSVSWNAMGPSCPNTSDGFASLSIQGGTPPYHILWNTSDTSLNLSNIPQGVYSATITDNNGCSVVETFELPSQIIAEFDISSDTLYANLDTVFFYNYSHNAQFYLWLFGNGSSSSDTNPYHVYTSAGTYTATLIAYSDSSCTDTAFATIVVLDSIITNSETHHIIPSSTPLIFIDKSTLTIINCPQYPYNLKIYDASGKIILNKENINSQTVKLPLNLPFGYFWIEIKTANFVYRKPFLLPFR